MSRNPITEEELALWSGLAEKANATARGEPFVLQDIGCFILAARDAVPRLIEALREERAESLSLQKIMMQGDFGWGELKSRADKAEARLKAVLDLCAPYLPLEDKQDSLKYPLTYLAAKIERAARGEGA